ncbi:slender lobes-like protein [Drosophila biarmipes]|uniref:slender lobes-like protein n=1 Tax=Drosophila biarmipes TaxID=125945 RepID=UPI001CDA7BEA|nr:slender lobes-like protein [Drosophila biarmipes]
MVLTRSGAKLKQSEGPSTAGSQEVKTSEPKAPASPSVKKRGAAAKRRPAPKKDVKELQVARQSLRDAMNLLAEKTSNDEEETAMGKNQKSGKKMVDKEMLASPNGEQEDSSAATNQKPTKKPLKKKTRRPGAKNTSPVKSADEENKPVRTSAGYLTITDRSPRREPSINLTKVRSNIKQQPLKPKADGKRKN